MYKAANFPAFQLGILSTSNIMSLDVRGWWNRRPPDNLVPSDNRDLAHLLRVINEVKSATEYITRVAEVVEGMSLFRQFS